MSKHSKEGSGWESPKPHPKGNMPADGEKVFVPDNIMQLIDAIVKDIGQVSTALNDVHSGNYAKAVQDLLAVVESIVVDMILPRIKSGQPPASGSVKH